MQSAGHYCNIHSDGENRQVVIMYGTLSHLLPSKNKRARNIDLSLFLENQEVV